MFFLCAAHLDVQDTVYASIIGCEYEQYALSHYKLQQFLPSSVKREKWVDCRSRREAFMCGDADTVTNGSLFEHTSHFPDWIHDLCEFAFDERAGQHEHNVQNRYLERNGTVSKRISKIFMGKMPSQFKESMHHETCVRKINLIA